MIFVILAGAPGSGKSTHSKLIKEKTDFVHISSGDIFRQEAEKNTELGLLAKSLIDKGNFIPDDIICNIIENIIKDSNQNTKYILDGFPRNLNQAIKFNEILQKQNLKINVFINLNVTEENLIQRLTKRGIDSNREDDANAEIIKRRIKLYKDKTQIINNFYQNNTNFFTIDGNKRIEEVHKEIYEIILRNLY